jgi:hypothetical protein
MPFGTKNFAIKCEVESLVISSSFEKEAWDSIEALVESQEKEVSNSSAIILFLWKKERNHLATAKETYIWRKVIDSIKASDLAQISSDLNKLGKGAFPLAGSKPIMLRVAGEITNALIHSYSHQHKISFIQCDSKAPSLFPT